VRIGANCNISPMVFLGFGAREGHTGVPTLGDRIYVAVGAKVIGPVRVGSDVAVGANAVVCHDVPDHVTGGGVPARVISGKGSGPYLQIGQELEVTPAEDERAGLAPVPPRSARHGTGDRSRKAG
jgi:serine O-acetyltransferase